MRSQFDTLIKWSVNFTEGDGKDQDVGLIHAHAIRNRYRAAFLKCSICMIMICVEVHKT